MQINVILNQEDKAIEITYDQQIISVVAGRLALSRLAAQMSNDLQTLYQFEKITHFDQATKHYFVERRAALVLALIGCGEQSSEDKLASAREFLVRVFPKLQQYDAGFSDINFVRSAIALTHSKFPYDFADDAVKRSESVALKALEFGLPIEKLDEALRRKFNDAAFVREVTKQSILLLRYADGSLLKDECFLLHVFVFGNWHPKKDDLTAAPYERFFTQLLNEKGRVDFLIFLKSIQALQMGSKDISHEYFMQLRDEHQVDAGDHESCRPIFRMTRRALEYYKERKSVFGRLFDSWNSHYMSHINEALVSLDEIEFPSADTSMHAPELTSGATELSSVCPIIENLSGSTPEKGSQSKLSSVLIDLVIRLANHARDEINTLEQYQPTVDDDPGAIARELTAWDAALEKLLSIQLTGRQLECVSLSP